MVSVRLVSYSYAMASVRLVVRVSVRLVVRVMLGLVLG